MTKHEIIDETVAYYSEDVKRRSVKGNECLYYNPNNGNMCAVGRCLVNPKEIMEGITASSALCDDEEDLGEGDGLLKPQYRGHHPQFWEDLQGLHDDNSNWNSTGLSVEGQRQVIILKSRWED